MAEADVVEEVEFVEEEVNPIEEKARDQGWRPKDEWEGDEADWVDAKEFVFRGELFDKIKSQSRVLKKTSEEMQELKDAVKQLGDLNKKISQKEYERALRELKRQKAEALSEDNFEAVVDLDEQIADVKKLDPSTTTSEEPASKEDKNTPPPEIQEWINSHSWYGAGPGKNRRMTAVTDAIAMDFMDENPDAPPMDLIRHVEAELKKEFPEKFGVRKTAPDPVSGTGARQAPNSGGKKKFTERHLTEEQKKIGNRLVSAGAFDKIQDYVDQLAEIGEIAG